MRWKVRLVIGASLLSLGCPGSGALASAQPTAISLMRAGDDRLTDDLVEAIHTASPTANVTLVGADAAGSVPVELGIPRSYGRHQFTIAVGSPHGKLAKQLRFAGFHVLCDRRRQDACAASVLSKLDSRFKGRG
jgi:hypothetical protein